MNPKRAILATAFLEGLCVLVIEIAGARAIAPYYGTSLRVWTAQITATLFFLAMGYGLGGRLSRAAGRWSLPAVFFIAGGWLVLFPWLRVPVLTLTSGISGIAVGSLLAASILFGPPLLCLGAVSPLLIQRMQDGDKGGAAAGGVFFTNTLGGLAGGWITALLLVPHVPLRLALAGTGLVLGVLGSVWARPLRKPISAAVPLLLAIILAMAPRPQQTASLGYEDAVILTSQASSMGLIQVMDIRDHGTSKEVRLLIDGINQGGMASTTHWTLYPFTEYQAYLSWLYHPDAARALQLGLGAGLLANSLWARGLDVDVVEIDPRVVSVSREYFYLPDEVHVETEDGRAFLNRSSEKWDLIFLDAYAGENAPWYLLTVEGIRGIREHLSPGGRMIINIVTRAEGSAGLARLESTLLEVFPEALVFVDAPVEGAGPRELVNACIVAGDDLQPGSGSYPGQTMPYIAGRVQALLPRGRAARAGAPVLVDDLSDLDVADAALRLEWRKSVLRQIGPGVLSD